MSRAYPLWVCCSGPLPWRLLPASREPPLFHTGCPLLQCHPMLNHLACRCSTLRLCHISPATAGGHGWRMPGALRLRWKLLLPEGCVGGSLPPRGVRLAREGLESCPHCATLRRELWEMEVPALRTRAVRAGIDQALIAETRARSPDDAKKELVTLIVRQASARNVQELLAQGDTAVGAPPRLKCDTKTFTL